MHLARLQLVRNDSCMTATAPERCKIAVTCSNLQHLHLIDVGVDAAAVVRLSAGLTALTSLHTAWR